MKGKLNYLAISMAVLLLAMPLLEKGTIPTILTSFAISAVCFFSVYAVSQNRRNLIIALSIGIPMFISTWVGLFLPQPSLILTFVNAVFSVGFFVFTASILFSFVFTSARVNGNVLYATVTIYMLIGGIFSSVYFLIESIFPGSFVLNSAVSSKTAVGIVDLIYFSFVTLTTLGYGDITPVGAQVKIFAVVEAIIGVMYLAIIISRLVGLHIVHASKTAGN